MPFNQLIWSLHALPATAWMHDMTGVLRNDNRHRIRSVRQHVLSEPRSAARLAGYVLDTFGVQLRDPGANVVYRKNL